MVLLGKRIKELRNRFRYTQTELATLVGITKSTVAAYENDTRLPSYEVLIKLSNIFKVSLDYLVLGKPMNSININGLSSEQIGAIQTLINYYHNNEAPNDYMIDIPHVDDQNHSLIEKISSK